MKTYHAPIFASAPVWEKAETVQLDSFHWEKESFVRPASFAQLCAVEGKGLYARLWSFEENVRCVFTKRDDPVYRDSCLEFFLSPFEGEIYPYINFEMNPRGVILSEFGNGRGSARSHLAELSEEAPVVTPFSVTENGNTAWGVELFASEKLLSDVMDKPFKIAPMQLRGNFYKCGDDTDIPHYGAFSPVDTVEKGFHNPEKFAVLMFEKSE